ncbi:hypothetical protein [Cedecea neteri]|uniref:hypothetical protein n=1 Tax=Cedecea neteri TaxID=158822 RepID=UPI0028A23053|nr:hypothetical protein [Cedecea neteri]
MTDIYHHLSLDNLRDLKAETLKEISRDCDAAVSGILSGIRAMGNLAFWASTSDDYDETQAMNDLRDLGESLIYLPRIVCALNENAQNAECELRERKKQTLKNS